MTAQETEVFRKIFQEKLMMEPTDNESWIQLRQNARSINEEASQMIQQAEVMETKAKLLREEGQLKQLCAEVILDRK